jgi:hypothetical protein
MIHYDLGKTLSLGIIPIVGMFTPRYYSMDITLADNITIYHEGKAVWEKTIPVHQVKKISASHFSSDGLHSDAAEKAYSDAQTPAVADTIQELGILLRGTSINPKKSDHAA